MAYAVHNFEQGDVLYAEQLNEMDEQIAANEESIENSVSSDMLASDYSANKTYSIGDYVIYNNELYTCIYEITAPEGWNSAHWRIANLGDGIGDLTCQISDVEENQIPELKSALSSEIKLISDGTYQIKADDLESGSINQQGAEVENGNRIRTNILPVNSKIKIMFSPGEKVQKYAYLLFDKNMEYIKQVAWKTGNITITDDCYYLRLVFASTSGTTALIPSDFDATVVIMTASMSEQFKNMFSISDASIMEKTDFVFEVGGINQNGVNNTYSKAIRTPTRNSIIVPDINGTVAAIELLNGYKAALHEYYGGFQTAATWVRSTPIKGVGIVCLSPNRSYRIMITTESESDSIDINNLPENFLKIVYSRRCFTSETTLLDIWNNASVSNSGLYAKASQWIASRMFSGREFIACRAINNKTFYIAAWDNNGNYLGKFTYDNAFSTTRADQVTFYMFSFHPEYYYVVFFAGESADAESIVFIKANEPLNRIDNSFDVIASGYKSTTIERIPVRLKSGMRFFATVIGENDNDGITLSFYNNNNRVGEEVINVAAATNILGGCGVKVLDQDANEIRISSNTPVNYNVISEGIYRPSVLANDVNDLKNTTYQIGIGEKSISDIWSKGGLTSYGTYSAYAGALNTRRIGYPEFVKCHTESGYYINVGAFDSNNSFLGKYTASGTWGHTPENITEFDFSKYPELSFVVTLFNGTNTISLSENINCIFETEYFDSFVPVVNGSSSFTELLASGTVPGGFIWHYPVDIKTGDTIIVRQSGSTRYAMAMKLCKNGQDVTVLWSTAYDDDVYGKSAKITMIDNADEVWVYSNQETSFEVRRLHTTMIPTVNCVRTCQGIENTDFLYAQILGENAISQNRKAIPEQILKMFLLDNSYKYFSVSSLKQIVDAMHNSGLNAFALGFTGGGLGLSFKLDDMTITSYNETYDLSNCVTTSSGKYLTESDMEELINYASQKGVEIIPYVGMPGHFTVFLDKYPRFAYRNRSSDAWKSLNVDDPKARDFAYQVAELYLRWFAKHECKYWLAGTDEFDSPRPGYSEAHTAGDYNYALFINELLFRIAKYRMIPIAWNDPFCINNSFYPFLNRNAMVLHWSGTSLGRASAVKVEENGNRLINSSAYIYYIEGQTVPSKTAFDNFNIHKFSDGSTISDPLGACFCAWIGKREDPPLDDDGQAIVDKLIPCIGYYGDSISSQFD